MSFSISATRSERWSSKTTLRAKKSSPSAIRMNRRHTSPAPTGKKKYSPTNLAIAPNGDIYVGDGYGSSYINQYDKQGRIHPNLRRARVRKPGKLSCPHGIIVDTRGKQPVLTVADRTNKRLQHFTLDGKHIGFRSGVKFTVPLQHPQGRRS